MKAEKEKRKKKEEKNAKAFHSVFFEVQKEVDPQGMANSWVTSTACPTV